MSSGTEREHEKRKIKYLYQKGRKEERKQGSKEGREEGKLKR